MQRSDPIELIGNTPQMRALVDEIAHVARSDAKVLISGESGAGKELVARSLHRASRRAAHPFVVVNCAGIPESLLESELFGHVKGSFTGAYRDRPGKLQMADTGTVFLDEVGEMTPRMQGLLLRFVEAGEVQRVGSDVVDRVHVRVVSATNRTLADLVAARTFREDLFYRLNVVELAVPPLRDRRDDVPLLAAHFLEKFRQRHDCPVQSLSADALECLVRYHWPGNVRQLENTIERLFVTVRRTTVLPEDLPPDMRAASSAAIPPFKERRRTIADDLYERLVDRGESFWTAVYPLYMDREITRSNLEALVHKALIAAHGNYNVVMRLFNLAPSDYKKFLNFLRTHDCRVPFQSYR